MIFKLDRRQFALLSALTIVACRGEDPGTSDATSNGTTTADSDSASSTVAPTTTETPPPTTSTTTTDPVDSTSTDPSTPTTDPCADSGGFIDCNETGTSDPLENGANCNDDADCASMNCYKNSLLMISICAECNEDADCVAAGTGIACNFDLGTQSIACGDGANGSTCMSDAACQSGHCDAVIEIPIPGVLPDTCGECSTSNDCDMDLICSPNFDFMAFSGQKKCVAPGSVENNQLCPKGDEGDLACMSGHCTNALLMGIVPVDICGECSTNDDCEVGQTCMPAEASMNGLSGSLCV